VGRVAKVEMTFFIVVEHESWALVWRGWLAAVVWIQYFDFGSRGETVGLLLENEAEAVSSF
jgi:hypothetical protein